MRIDLSKRVPAGVDWRRERGWIITALVAAFLYSLGFVIRFSGARSKLFEWDGAVRALIPGAVMPDFAELLGTALLGFPLAALLGMGAAAYWNYAYHRSGSMSIYLMRRLPDKRELHRRCLSFPLAGIAILLLAGFLTLLLYYALYMLCTPAPCLTQGQWAGLWSAWTGVFS